MSIIRNVATAIVGNEARKRGKGSGLLGFGLGIIATRIATRSLPGAILVGAGLVAKTLLDRQREQADASETDLEQDLENAIPTDPPTVIEGVAREKKKPPQSKSGNAKSR